MKAPDKICVAPHQIFDYDLDIQEVGHNGAEEYIRKDALLEWVKKQKKEELARNSIGVITGKALFVDADELLSFIDTLSEEPDKSLEEAADDKPKIMLHEYNGDEGIGIVVDSDVMKVIIIQK